MHVLHAWEDVHDLEEGGGAVVEAQLILLHHQPVLL